MRARDRLIVALDSTALAPALRVARRLQGLVRTVKVGSALFTSAGPDVIRRLRGMGFGVMLDLKFFDIPSTVELSCQAATRLRVSSLTVHASGGRDMLKAAVRGVRAEAHRLGVPQSDIFAVTKLTSLPPPPTTSVGPKTKGGRLQMRRDVAALAYEAADAGCHGVIASVQETPELRKIFPSLTIVCPGIRPSWAFRDDQRRIGTPAEALTAGANFLVIGRPITESDDPRQAVRRILEDMEERCVC